MLTGASFFFDMYILCFAPGDSPEDVNAPTKWCRPPLPNMKADKDKLIFQQIDVDHYIGKTNETVGFFGLHRKYHSPLILVFRCITYTVSI